MNGLKFILNFPVIQEGSMLYISRMDLAKLVEPVLRPAKIQTAPVRTVVLDAGHGGFDQGARSALGNEEDFALDVILRAGELFARAGFSVRLTRSADLFLPLATAMHASLITRLGVRDRGIKRARFVVLKNDAIPGVLIEGGFLTNPRDAARIAAPAYRQMMAQAIFQGVLAYNRAVERSSPGASSQVAEKDHAPAGTGDSVWDPLKSNVYSLPQELHR